jgi:shikimate kinase
MNIFLIGYRCTGKSIIGRSLSNKLAWPFIDADLELIEEYGMTISEIVEKLGWDQFREMERSIIKKASQKDKYIVATGGGAVLDSKNVERMKRNGALIWLKATPQTIKKRILADKSTADMRPSLTSKGTLKEIEDTLLKRNPYYESAKDFCVETDDLGINAICDIILTQMDHFGLER